MGGPEKLMEIWFTSDANSSTSSLRDVPQEVWQECLNDVCCQILSTICNEHVTAFLLSESSMFVYDDKVYIKTCGTTTLLRFLPGMIRIAKSCGLSVIEDMFYSRQNFFFPEQQQFPHTSFDAEVAYLNSEFRNGPAFTLGRINGSHYNFFNAEAGTPRHEADSSLEIMMTGLDPALMRAHFFKDTFVSGGPTLKNSGIGDLFPEAQIDEYVFDPCGYSMNGILADGSVSTIHITPQDTHSYASFECNVILADYTELLHKVLKIFQPRQFMVVSSCNHAFLVEGQDPSRSAFITQGVPGYVVQDQADYRFQSYKLNYLNFRSEGVVREERQEESQPPAPSSSLNPIASLLPLLTLAPHLTTLATYDTC